MVGLTLESYRFSLHKYCKLVILKKGFRVYNEMCLLNSQDVAIFAMETGHKAMGPGIITLVLAEVMVEHQFFMSKQRSMNVLRTAKTYFKTLQIQNVNSIIE